MLLINFDVSLLMMNLDIYGALISRARATSESCLFTQHVYAVHHLLQHFRLLHFQQNHLCIYNFNSAQIKLHKLLRLFDAASIRAALMCHYQY